MKPIRILLLALAISFGLAASAQAQTVSPLETFHNALNSYDLAGIKAVVTDTFVMKFTTGSGLPEDEVVLTNVGFDQEAMDRARRDHFTIQISDIVTNGNTITFRFTMSGDESRSREPIVGIPRGTGEAHVENDKLASIVYTFDMDFVNMSKAAYETELPKTGTALNMWGRVLLVIVGVFLIVGGAWIARPRWA